MKKPKIHVTDHAVIRYLERVLGFDVETHRRKIGQIADECSGMNGVISGGFVYKVREGKVVTVAPTGKGNRRPRQQKRYK